MNVFVVWNLDILGVEKNKIKSQNFTISRENKNPSTLEPIRIELWLSSRLNTISIPTCLSLKPFNP